MTFALCIVNNFLYIYLIFNTKTVFYIIHESIQIDYIFLKDDYMFNHYTACIYIIKSINNCIIIYALSKHVFCELKVLLIYGFYLAV